MNVYKPYAGIGSRSTPPEVLKRMRVLGYHLALAGYTLRSGGAEGADTAFEEGAIKGQGEKEIYLPWKNFNNNPSDLYTAPSWAHAWARAYHPVYHSLQSSTQKLMARNSMQIAGQDQAHLSLFVCCWTADGKASGGTGQALRIAADKNIPIFNLHNPQAYEELIAACNLRSEKGSK